MSNNIKKIFVIPNNGKWKVDGIGKKFDSRKEAVDAGAKIGRKNGNAELIVKKIDGKISEKRTYGSDPFPPSN